MPVLLKSESHNEEHGLHTSSYVSCHIGAIVRVYNLPPTPATDVQLSSFFSVISDFDSVCQNLSFTDVELGFKRSFNDLDEFYPDVESELAERDFEQDVDLQIPTQSKFPRATVFKSDDMSTEDTQYGKGIADDTYCKYTADIYKDTHGTDNTSIFTFSRPEKVYKTTLRVNFGTQKFERQFEDIYDKNYDLKGATKEELQGSSTKNLFNFNYPGTFDNSKKSTGMKIIRDQHFPECQVNSDTDFLLQSEKAYEFQELDFPEQLTEVHQYTRNESYVAYYDDKFQKQERDENNQFFQKGRFEPVFPISTTCVKYAKRKLYDLGSFEDFRNYKRGVSDQIYTTSQDNFLLPSVTKANTAYQKVQEDGILKDDEEASVRKLSSRSSREKKIVDSYLRQEKEWICHDSQYYYLVFDPNLGLCSKDETEASLRKKRCRYKRPSFAEKLPKTPSPQALTVPIILILGGINLKNPSDTSIGQMILGYHPLWNQWGYAGHMVEPRNHHTAVMIDDDIFIIGGCDPQQLKYGEMVATDSVLSYNIRERRWKRCTNMSTPRSHHNSVVMDNKIYCIGGRDQGGRILRSVEKYDVERNRWTEIPDAPYPLMGSTACIFYDCILVIGGVTVKEKHQSLTSNVLIYHPKDNSWSYGPELPFPIAYACSASTATGTWVSGGLTTNKENVKSLETVFTLDVKKERWLDVLQLSSPRHSATSVSIESYAYVIGGASTYESSSVDNHDLIQGIGKRTLALPPLPITLTGSAALVLKPFILSAYTGDEINSMITKML